MMKPRMLDTTLRDGEQSPGIYFTDREKRYIAKELDEIGVEIIEAGIPAMGKEEQQTLKRIRKEVLHAEVLSWNRLLKEDVDASLLAGIIHMHVSAPTSDLMLQHKMGKRRDWLLRQIDTVIPYALERGAILSFGAEDASRTDLVFLKEIFTRAAMLGATRVRYADTLGLLTPLEVQRQMNFLTHDLDVDLDFHGHNDFGLATANALTAWESGAKVLSCSVLGLGERAGNTSLEEMQGVLSHLKNSTVHIDFARLKKLSLKISRLTKIAIPSKQPIIGERIYMHESGIHVDGLLKESMTYEPFPPERNGGKREIVAGKHSGSAAIKYLAKEAGYDITDSESNHFISNMRQVMMRQRGLNATKMLNDYLKDKEKSLR